MHPGIPCFTYFDTIFHSSMLLFFIYLFYGIFRIRRAYMPLFVDLRCQIFVFYIYFTQAFPELDFTCSLLMQLTMEKKSDIIYVLAYFKMYGLAFQHYVCLPVLYYVCLPFFCCVLIYHFISSHVWD